MVSSINKSPVEDVINISYSKGSIFDVCEINGNKFALLNKEMSSKECEYTIDLKDYYVVLLSPIVAEKDIVIDALSLIGFHNLTSNKGQTKITTEKKLILLGVKIQSLKDNILKSKSDSVLISGIIKERKEMICKLFAEGIEKGDGIKIMDALIETVEAVQDPSGENESETIDVAVSLKSLSLK